MPRIQDMQTRLSSLAPSAKRRKRSTSREENLQLDRGFRTGFPYALGHCPTLARVKFRRHTACLQPAFHSRCASGGACAESCVFLEKFY